MSSPPTPFDDFPGNARYSQQQEHLAPLSRQAYNQPLQNNAMSSPYHQGQLPHIAPYLAQVHTDRHLRRFFTDHQMLALQNQSGPINYLQRDVGSQQQYVPMLMQTPAPYYAKSLATSTSDYISMSNVFSEPYAETRATSPGDHVHDSASPAHPGTPQAQCYDDPTAYPQNHVQFAGSGLGPALLLPPNSVNPRDVHLTTQESAYDSTISLDIIDISDRSFHVQTSFTGDAMLNAYANTDGGHTVNTSSSFNDVPQFDVLHRSSTLQTTSSIGDDETPSSQVGRQQVLHLSGQNAEAYPSSLLMQNVPSRDHHGDFAGQSGRDPAIDIGEVMNPTISAPVQDEVTNNRHANKQDNQDNQDNHDNHDIVAEKPKGKKRSRKSSTGKDTKGKVAETAPPAAASRRPAKKHKKGSGTAAASPPPPQAPPAEPRPLVPSSPRVEFACAECLSGIPISFATQADLSAHIKLKHRRYLHCRLRFAGCDKTFSTKNEWKRHVLSQHVLNEYWSCTLCARSQYFARKDLFVQHLWRMHTPPDLKTEKKRLEEALKEAEKAPRRSGQKPAAKSRSKKKGPAADQGEEAERLLPQASPKLEDIRKKHIQTERDSYHERISLPSFMQCPAPGCITTHQGEGAWDKHMEHVAGHLEGVSKGSEEPFEFGAPQDEAVLILWALGVGILKNTRDGLKLIPPIISDDTAEKRQAKQQQHQGAAEGPDLVTFAAESEGHFMSQDEEDALGEPEQYF